MNKLKIVGFLCVMLSAFSCHAQNNDIKNISDVIVAFSQAGDNNDATDLEKHLDDNYRIVMNRLFGMKDVSIMSKTVYLQKIKSKEYGGDARKVAIENVVVNGSTAVAKVRMEGKKATFVSLLNLVKDDKNVWKLISDIPIVK